MAYNLTFRLHSDKSISQRFLRECKWIYHLKMKVPLRYYSSAIPSKYYEKKYDILRSRLAAIPVSDILNKQKDKFQQDLFYEKDEKLKDVLKHCSEVFDYNTRNSVLYFGGNLLKSYCAYNFSMTDSTWNQWDSDGWRSAAILAWIMELLAGYLNITDDILDQSYLRRGQLCWFRKPEVGLSAINDSILLQWSAVKLLRKYFEGSKAYMNVLNEFFQGNLQNAYGQCFDWTNKINQTSRSAEFTFEKLNATVEFRTSHCGNRLPVHFAMHLAGGCSEKDFDFTRKICLKLGQYYALKDDIKDISMPIEKTGLKGNDIREGKLTWLPVKFLEVASESMKKQFMEYFGVNDEDAVDKILELYKKANMMERFEEFEKQLQSEISSLIDSMNDVKGALYYEMLHDLERRKIV